MIRLGNKDLREDFKTSPEAGAGGKAPHFMEKIPH